MIKKTDSPATRSVEVAIDVPGTPEEVWRAIATGPGFTAWFVPTRLEECEGGAVNFEFHAEPDGGPRGYAQTYEKSQASEAAGTLMAPFSGIHGWYWENRTDRDVVVRIMSAGHYTESLEFRRKQDVKRKPF